MNQANPKENMDQTNPTKNHWDDVATRTKATLAFAKYLQDNPNEVEPCKTNSDYAKQKFANGYFYLEGDPNADPNIRPIPRETVFRVYDFDPKPERDKLVTLVLPDPNAGTTPKVQDIWLCSWPNWFSLR